MNRYSRKPKNTKKSLENDERDERDEDNEPEVEPIAQRHLLTIKSLGRPYRTDEEKEAVFYQLVRLKENRKTNQECADILGVSVRTVANYLSDPYYGELHHALQQESKERGHLLITDVIDDAIQKLYGLMGTAKSEFVQYKSAEYLLKMAGYEIPQEHRERDNQADVLDFLSKLNARQNKTTQINVQITNTTDASSQHAQNASGGQNEGVVVDSHVVTGLLSKNTSESVVVPELERYMRPMLPGGKLPKIDDDDDETGRSRAEV